MRAVLIKESGGPDQLYIGSFETPQPQKKEVLVKVKASALNRADTLQRMGKYPPPSGASPILGLEIAGEIEELGEECTHLSKGDRIMALLAGGGYAEFAIVHEDMCIPIPDHLTFEEAAAIPEVWLTAYQALFWLAHIQKGDRILIHAGASGVGTAAIQLARPLASHIFITASERKHGLCISLGADYTIDYQSQDFAQVIDKETDKKGVNIILDFIAAPYFSANLASLSIEGKLIVLALMGGTHLQNGNLGPILRKRLSIIGSTLRTRILAYKIELTQAFWKYAAPHFEQKTFKPVIDSIYSWEEVGKAHERMEANQNAGKIILRIER